MADQPFALSPISASSVSPTQSDYDAISEAFMETARGRWFLAEYAKRNRNADTAMVLDAVARIERSLAAEKNPAPNGVADVLAAVGSILAMARANAEGAMATAIIEETLAPSRKCARIIHEIAWGLRESGADGRICTLLESQVDAINAACDHVAASGLRDGVLKAFDQASEHIAALGDGSMPTAQAPPQAAEESDTIVATAETRVTPMPDVEIAAPAEATTVAANMHAPPPAIEQDIVEIEIAESIVVEPLSETIIVAEETDATIPLLAVAEPATTLTPATSSLGASLLANGIVPTPAPPRNDPLAALRRMSSAEKVAFFS